MKRYFEAKNLVASVNWFLNTVFVFAPAYLKTLNLSGWHIGILTSNVYIVPMLLYTPAGHLCDVISPKTVLFAGLALFSLFSLLLTIFERFETLLLSYLLGSAGIALLNISIDTLFYKSGREKEDFSGYIGYGGIGMGIGYLIAGAMIGSTGFHSFFYLLSAVSILTSAVSPFVLKEKAEILKHNPSIGSFWKERNFVLLLCVNFLHGIHFGAETSALAIFFKEVPKMTEYEIGIVLSLSIFFLAFCGLLTKNLAERGLNGKKIYTLGLLLSGSGSLLMSFSERLYTVLLFRFLHVSGDAFIFVGSRMFASSLFGSEKIGMIWGGVRSSVALAAFSGAILSGILIQHMGAYSPFTISGLLSILSISFLP